MKADTRRTRMRRRAGRLPARPPGRNSPWPYRARRALLSRGELAFYRVLRAALGGRVGIAVKVRLADVIWCPPRLFRRAPGARVSQKHLDFVLYDLSSTKVLLALELDDRSHESAVRRARDVFVEEVLTTCGVRLLRVRAASRYDREALRACLEGLGARGGRRTRPTRERCRGGEGA